LKRHNQTGRAGNSRENSLKALSAYQSALQVHTRQQFPQSWARTNLCVGNLYSDLKQYDDALSAYQSALQVYTLSDFPYEWAILQDNIGQAYHHRESKDSKIEDYDTALTFFQNSFQVITLEEFPSDWTRVQNNMASLYRSKGQIDEAIKHWKAAIVPCRLHGDSDDWLALGMTYGSQAWHWKKWKEAIEGFSLVIDAIELDRTWSITDVRRQQILTDTIGLYEMVIDACLKNKQPGKAIEYAERSKARGLFDNLANKNYPDKRLFEDGTYREICQKLDKFRGNIKKEQLKIEIEEKKNPTHSKREDGSFPPILIKKRDQLNRLNQQMAEFVKNKIQSRDSSFILTPFVQAISFEEIQSLLPDKKTVIIEWYILSESILAFLITQSHPEILTWQYDSLDLKSLNIWLDNYLDGYNKPLKKNWADNLKSSLNELERILKISEILDCIDALHPCPDQIIFIPHRSLHLLPLHALPLKNKPERCLLDKFGRGIRYVPSAQTLKEIKNYKRSEIKDFLGVQNPTKDLTYADLQVQSISENFHRKYIFSGDQATKSNLIYNKSNLRQLRSTHCLHFACHGDFKEESPLESYLKLAEGDFLKLDEIFNLSLNQCRLVTLSACETGLTDHTSISDEYIGLPGGFLYAGSPSVVSSLWKVDEIATAFLMIKFYENLRHLSQQREGSISIALNKAQLWLKSLTCKTFFEEELPKYHMQVNQLYTSVSKGRRLILEDSLRQVSERKPYPFRSPFFWAGFVAIGY
jgi:CHAT domain-containing protein